MSALSNPAAVLVHLRAANQALGDAHRAAGEHEAGRTNLVGSVRDLLFGLNTGVEALMQMIEEERFGEG